MQHCRKFVCPQLCKVHFYEKKDTSVIMGMVKLSWVLSYRIIYKFKTFCLPLNNPLCNPVGKFIVDDTFWP